MLLNRSFIALLFAVTLVAGGFMPCSSSSAIANEDPSASSPAHTDPGHAKPKGDANPLVGDPDLAIFTVFVFIGLMIVLRVFAWGPIVQALDSREQTVADHLAAAAEKHEEAKSLLSAHEARLASAKAEVREMLEEAHRDAEETKSRIVSEADAVALAHRNRAIRDIEQARDSAVRELAETSAHLAVDLAEKVVRQNLSGEQQADLVREAISKLTNSTPSSN